MKGKSKHYTLVTILFSVILLFMQCWMVYSAYSIGRETATIEKTQDELNLCRSQQQENLDAFKADLQKYKEAC